MLLRSTVCCCTQGHFFKRARLVDVWTKWRKSQERNFFLCLLFFLSDSRALQLWNTARPSSGKLLIFPRHLNRRRRRRGYNGQYRQIQLLFLWFFLYIYLWTISSMCLVCWERLVRSSRWREKLAKLCFFLCCFLFMFSIFIFPKSQFFLFSVSLSLSLFGKMGVNPWRVERRGKEDLSCFVK